MSEYPGFPAMVPSGSMLETFFAAIDIIDAITDQGEGSKIGPVLRETLLHANGLKYNKVEHEYQSLPRARLRAFPCMRKI